jgi:hypothetical protein
MAVEQQSKRSPHTVSDTPSESKLDLDALLYPARAFAHPSDVVRDRDLTRNEKRAILASWASDACAIEAAPELRLNSAGSVVRWDDIMDALRMLDGEAGGNNRPRPRYKRVLALKSAGLLGLSSRPQQADDEGRSPD